MHWYDKSIIDKSGIGEQNSEPALAGDISIAMGWSSTLKVGVDREADEAPSRAEPLVQTKKYFGTRGTGDRSLGCIDRQRFPVSGLAPFAVAGCHPLSRVPISLFT